jgi:hypothetical protein
MATGIPENWMRLAIDNRAAKVLGIQLQYCSQTFINGRVPSACWAYVMKDNIAISSQFHQEYISQ